MGNSNQSLYHIRKYDPSEWVSLGKIKHCQILRNCQTGTIAEAYNLPIDNNVPFIQNMQRYRYRQQANHNFVIVYQVQKQSSEYLCQGEQQLKVITERIPVRLSQLKNVSVPEAFYILFESLIGYKHILEVHGVININDEMIGFTGQGKIRIWLNQNYASNYPNENMENIFNTLGEFNYGNAGSQIRMLNQLYYSIESHMVEKRFPQRFQRLFKNQNHLDFDIALNLINNYVKNQRIPLVQQIQIQEILNQNSKFPVEFYSQQNFHDPSKVFQQQFRANQKQLSINAQRQRGVTNPGRYNSTQQKNTQFHQQILPQRRQTVSSLSFKTQNKNLVKFQQEKNISLQIPNKNQSYYPIRQNIPINNFISNNQNMKASNQFKTQPQILRSFNQMAPIQQENTQRIVTSNRYQVEPMPITNNMINSNGLKSFERYPYNNSNDEPTARINNKNFSGQSQQLMRQKRSYDVLPLRNNFENIPQKNNLRRYEEEPILTEYNSKQTESVIKNVPIQQYASNSSYQEIRGKMLGHQGVYNGNNRMNNLNRN